MCFYRKTESSDMQDLVHMMTQTLRMDFGDGIGREDKSKFGSTAMPEFRLNKKYRDTLVLHGKAGQKEENLSIGEIPIGQMLWPNPLNYHPAVLQLLYAEPVRFP